MNIHFKKMKLFLYLFVIITCLACKNKTESAQDKALPKASDTKELNLKYAKGFSVTNHENFKVLTIEKPWPKAEKTYKYILISKENMAKTSFMKDAYDGIIVNPVNRIVVTSTTHIPALELLNVEGKLVGFPGTDYISSEKTRTNISTGNVKELGQNESINTEILLELNPDVVVGFGVEGVNKTFETIKKANIPVIYNGDWVESSALAKAEWIKFFGVLFNEENQADSIFNTIEKEYLKAKSIAKKAKEKPTVLSGAMEKDIWYLPNGSSPEAQFFKDANINYLWSNTTGNGSLALSFEAVFEKARDADLWFSPSYYSSLEDMEKANSLYTNFEAFKSQNVYSFTNTKGKTGGVLYYEMGTTRPDLVLKDLVKIAHPELLEGYKPYFFKKLN